MEREPASGLQGLLRDGEFVVTAELETSDSADPEETRSYAASLRGYVDALNCTDNTGANVHLCSLAAARLVLDAGMEPNMQLTCRDRNRLALQGDLLGAAALGVANVTFMSGDDVGSGDHPEARPVFELDSLQLVRTARIMRDEGTYLSGRKLTSPPRFFIGAVENPFAPPYEFRPHRVGKKVEAGADFIQTQTVLNVARFREFMSQVADLGLLERVFILPSVAIIRSARSARFMKEKVPGMDVPDEVVHRLESLSADQQPEEGLRIAEEVISELREIPGVSGVHLIAIRWVEGVPRLVEAMNLSRASRSGAA
jgi:methylenetetrahydrofolate reductase (NADPH)